MDILLKVSTTISFICLCYWVPYLVARGWYKGKHKEEVKESTGVIICITDFGFSRTLLPKV